MENNKINYDTTYYLVAMLKKYGIKNIVASPGMQNAKFNILVQDNTFFNCYSVVDERSCAYFATGISYETQEPTVITCTEATSDRNFLSALTEAYYRKIPLIALTFFNSNSNKFNLAPQFVERSMSQNDVKTLFVELPKIKDISDKKRCLDYLNAAIATAKYKKEPVIINCPSFYDYKNIHNTLPEDIWSFEYFKTDFSNHKKELKNKNIMVFIGSHNKFSNEEKTHLENFAKSWDCPIVCDHSANYNGENKILTSQLTHFLNDYKKPDLIIDIGDICGEYTSIQTFGNAKIWRISERSNFTFRYSKPIEKFFNCCEKEFFEKLINKTKVENGYFTYLKNELSDKKHPDVKLSAIHIAKKLSEFIPDNSSLNLAILNSLRSMNFFDLKNTIDVNCNVGGFGIDGGLSTAIGQSVVNKDKKIFCLLGDLAFFYDMNILGNRHISNNLRVILINNQRGEEFRINPALEEPFKDKTDKLIAAYGHYKNGAKDWAKSCDFHYICAKTKDEFDKKIKEFCQKDYDRPVFFEVFTKNADEQNAINVYRQYSK